MFLSMASIEDADAIARNDVDLRREIENVSMDIQSALAGVRTLIASPERGFYLLAKQDEEVIGQVLVTHEWSDWRNQDIWWLHRIYVKPAWRHKGILTKLFNEIQEKARGKNVYAIRLYLHEENQDAVNIYRRLGMERTPFHIFSVRV